MKTIKWLAVVLTVAVFTSLLPAAAGDVAYTVTGTAVSTNISYAIIPVPPEGGQAKVTSVAAITDNATKGLLWYKLGSPYVINTASSGTTNEFRITNTGTAIASNDVVILYRPAAATYTRLYVTNATTTNIQTSAASPAAVATGDIIWEGTASSSEYTLTSGTSTLFSTPGMIYGEQSKPLLVEVNGVGTNTVKLLWLSAEFVKP